MGNSSKLSVLIMAGGSGERFWPLSTIKKPKQVLSIFSDKPMIRETVDRILPLVGINNVFVATNEKQSVIISDILYDLPVENLIIEPEFKDTAAAIGFGVLNILRKFPDSNIAVLASDHIIKDEAVFRDNLHNASVNTMDGNIIIFGIKPTKPETGYGYIELNNLYELNTIQEVKSFKEKPDLETAKKYIQSNSYLWNSGMFVFNGNDIMNIFKTYAPNHYVLLNQISNVMGNEYGVKLTESVAEIFKKFEKKSIDYVIMEKYPNIKVIPIDVGWSDVGDFSALREILNADTEGNNKIGNTIFTIDASNNVIINVESSKPLAVLGVSDCVIVNAQDGILICSKNDTQRIKEIIRKITDEVTKL